MVPRREPGQCRKHRNAGSRSVNFEEGLRALVPSSRRSGRDLIIRVLFSHPVPAFQGSMAARIVQPLSKEVETMARSKKISILIGALLFVTPFCTPDLAAREGGDFVLLIRMMGIQDAWFRENIIPSFEKEHDAKVTVASFDKFWDLEFMLKLEEEGKRHSIGLVKTPLEMTRPLRKYMLPYDDERRRPEGIESPVRSSRSGAGDH